MPYIYSRMREAYYEEKILGFDSDGHTHTKLTLPFVTVSRN